MKTFGSRKVQKGCLVPHASMGRAWQVCVLAWQSWISEVLDLGFKRLGSLAPFLQGPGFPTVSILLLLMVLSSFRSPLLC